MGIEYWVTVMIGIISHPSLTTRYTYPDEIIQWIAMTGEESMVIPYDIPVDSLRRSMTRLDGIVWMGGAIETGPYDEYRMTYLICLYTTFLLAKEINDRGRVFPIFGICLGFETLILLERHTPSMTLFSNMKRIKDTNRRPLIFSGKSRMGSYFKNKDQMKSTICVKENHWKGFYDVPPTIRIVGKQHDYVNMIEFKNYPFYGVLFHIERPFDDFSRSVSYQFSCFLRDSLHSNKIDNK